MTECLLAINSDSYKRQNQVYIFVFKVKFKYILDLLTGTR